MIDTTLLPTLYPIASSPLLSFITAGLGLVQREGGAVEQVRPDDVVWFGRNE